MTGQQGGRGIRASFYSTIAKQQTHPATKQDNLDLHDVCAKTSDFDQWWWCCQRTLLTSTFRNALFRSSRNVKGVHLTQVNISGRSHHTCSYHSRLHERWRIFFFSETAAMWFCLNIKMIKDLCDYSSKSYNLNSNLL